MWGHVLPNGNFDSWTGTTPDQMDAQVTNTTVSRLRNEHRSDHGLRATFVEPPYIGSGESSYRATIAAGSAARDWRLYTEGVNVDTLADAAGLALPITMGRRYVFSFLGRGDIEARVRLCMRSTADAVGLYVVGAFRGLRDSQYTLQTAAGDITDIGLGSTWRRYAIAFEVPFGEAGGNLSLSTLAWQIANDDAGAGTIDIDNITFEDLSDNVGHDS